MSIQYKVIVSKVETKKRTDKVWQRLHDQAPTPDLPQYGYVPVERESAETTPVFDQLVDEKDFDLKSVIEVINKRRRRRR